MADDETGVFTWVIHPYIHIYQGIEIKERLCLMYLDNCLRALFHLAQGGGSPQGTVAQLKANQRGKHL